MKYERPTVVLLATAVKAVRSPDKESMDVAETIPPNTWHSMTAYQADE